jgi:hypothetical protein
MSRYRITSHASRSEVIVGWDPPLETFFGQVFVPAAAEEDDDACVLWVGGALRALPTVAVLQECLRGYATLPEDVVARLHHDEVTTTQRTPLQERMVQLLAPDRAEKEPVWTL